MKITKQRLKEIIIEEISEVQFGFPSLGLTLADVTPGAKDNPEDDADEDEEEPKKPERPPINPDIAAYRKKYGGGKFISTPRSNQGSDIKKRPRRYQENKQMKITKEQLNQIIKEELEAVMDEGQVSIEPSFAYDFTPEQQAAMRGVIEKLNNRKTLRYDTVASALRFLKYRHPAFKGFKGDPLDIQNGLKSLGYKGYTVSTTAIP